MIRQLVLIAAIKLLYQIYEVEGLPMALEMRIEQKLQELIGRL